MAKRLSTKPRTRRAYAQPVGRKTRTRPVADLKYKYYLYDLGEIVKTRALEAKNEQVNEEREAAAYHFQCGRLIAFNEVVSIFQQQAASFDISLEELNLSDVDPDRDLV